MPINRLREFLDEHQTKYVVISHSLAYTAQEVAASAHIPGKEIAKTVMVNMDGELAMIVLPASYQINFERLKEATGVENIELANEDEFKNLFLDCEVGAMPPFGNLYDIDVWVEESLTEDEDIAFNGGNHRELVQMKYDDFAGLVDSNVAGFAQK